MKNWLKYWLVFFLLLCRGGVAMAQCTVIVDNANLQHVNCPNGGAVGGASIIQASYINYSWENITNGQFYNGGGGFGGTSRSDLDAGFYVVTASSPYNSSCPQVNTSAPFEILEATPQFQFNPTQACPDTCNVEVTIGMQIAIIGVNYSSSFDSYPSISLPYVLNNQCGGSHTYEIFANGISCGIENIGISQLAQMNLATSVINATCTQQGSATVNITGVGASSISTYCTSASWYNNYTTIDNILLVGDNTTISNNTSGICDNYQDYTAQFADVTPGSSYNLNIDLGTCNFNGPNGSPQYLIDIANVYVDWNIDGDFNDLNEWIGQVNPTQSPSTHILAITVPVGAIPGQSRMRIVAQNNQYQPTNQALPCDVNIAWFGSTEDYTLVVSGSVAAPVTYLWSDGQTTATANLGAGTYTVTITDANGCTASDTALVGSGGGTITSGITPTLQTICQNSPSSNLTVTANGGIVPYQFQWYEYSSPNQASSAVIIPNEIDSFLLPPTNIVGITYYYCVVTSGGQGCEDTTSIVTVETVLAPIFTLHPEDSAVCIGSNLTINVADTFFVTVGANAIIPVYQWYENSICDTTVSGGSVPATGPGNNTNTYTPQTITTGTTYYYCTVVYPQIVGCNTIISECAEIIVNPIPTVTLSAVPNPACLGDDIVLTAVASTGFSCVTSCHEVEVIINTDANGSEISWDITDNTGVILDSGGPYANGVNTYTSIACLPFGAQLDFNWYDSQGDGWNDGINQGSFSVMQSAATLTQGSPSSGSSGSATFSITSSTSPCTSSPSLISYEYRFMYNNGSGWNNLTAPSWDINNPVTYNNITQSTQFRVKAREYNGCPNSSWSPIITVPVNIAPITGSIWHN